MGNNLELKAVKYAILTFTYLHPSEKSIHLQMDNVVAFSFLMKMGGTQNETSMN